MPDFDSPTTAATSPLVEDLLRFYDDFTEFHDYCAFLCDVCAGMAAEPDRFEEDTLCGLRLFSMEVKQRSATLKMTLRRIREKSDDRRRRTHGE